MPYHSQGRGSFPYLTLFDNAPSLVHTGVPSPHVPSLVLCLFAVCSLTCRISALFYIALTPIAVLFGTTAIAPWNVLAASHVLRAIQHLTPGVARIRNCYFV